MIRVGCRVLSASFAGLINFVCGDGIIINFDHAVLIDAIAPFVFAFFEVLARVVGQGF